MIVFKDVFWVKSYRQKGNSKKKPWWTSDGGLLIVMQEQWLTFCDKVQ